MTFLIILITLLAIGLVAFITWFFSMKANGRCPICAMKRMQLTKLSMDVSKEKDYDNNASSTPLMGWSSWNLFRNHIDEQTIYETAVAMQKSGLAAAGYKYINLDDCWQSSMRDEDGKMQGDLEAFPSGIDDLVRKVNALGLKVGIYSSNGTLTCEDLPASLHNEDLDAKTFASWGIEYCKYDFCHHEYISGKCPAIEYLGISKVGEREFLKLKPEDAKFTGMARVIKYNSFPSKKAIGYINHGAGSASFITNIPLTDEYIVTFHFGKYASKSRPYVQLTINGKMHEVFFPATKRAASPDARVQVKVKLEAGENIIKLANPVATLADSSYIQYKRMGEALKNATKAWSEFTQSEEKPITYSICEWGLGFPWNWGAKAGNMWRTTMDILPHWSSVIRIYMRNVKLYKQASPGHFNDPDMLEVGNGKLTDDENKSHFSLWCMMAAPLVLGNDVRKLIGPNMEPIQNNKLLEILTNKSMILIDQDQLGKQAKRIKHSLTVDILAKPLYNGDVAICFFNKSKSKKTVTFDINNLCDDKYLQFTKESDGYELHDLWSDERSHNSTIACSVPGHGVKVYRISK